MLEDVRELREFLANLVRSHQPHSPDNGSSYATRWSLGGALSQAAA
jgi:hypothetical protein